MVIVTHIHISPGGFDTGESSSSDKPCKKLWTLVVILARKYKEMCHSDILQSDDNILPCLIWELTLQFSLPASAY
jgi:hypothetical protein